MKNRKSTPSSGDNYFDKESTIPGLKGRAIRSAGAVVVSRATLYVINMFSVIILARLVLPGDFGLVAMVTAPFMILLDFGSMGLSEATIQNEDINHRQVSTLFWINVIASLALACLLIALSPLIVLFYKESRLQPITIAIALVFILGGLSTQHLALLRRNMQFYRITAIEISASIISVVTAIAFAWQGGGYWAIVARQIVFSAVTTVGAWTLCPWRPGLPARNANIRADLRFGINFLGGNTIYYFSKNLDKVLLGWRYGSQSLGYYDRAFHLFSMPLNQLVFPLGNVAFSALSRLRNDPDQFKRSYLKSISMLAFIGMPLGVLLTLTGKDLILLLLGPQWNMAGQLFAIMSLSIGMSLIYMTSGWINLSLGRADRNLRWILFSVLITTFLYMIGLPFGAIGIAIAFTVCPYILIVPALLYAGSPIDLKLSSIISAIGKYVAAAFLAGVLTWFLLNKLAVVAHIAAGLNIVVRILLPSLISMSLYLILVVLFYQSTAPIAQFISMLREMAPLPGRKG